MPYQNQNQYNGGMNMNAQRQYQNITVNNGAQQQGAQREKLKIKVPTPKEFKGTIRSEYITTLELANDINALFKPLIGDYEGCTVMPDPYGQLVISLFLKDKGAPGVGKALEPIANGSSRGQGGMARIQNINAKFSAKTYQLTQDAKDVFEDFVIKPKNNKIDWNKYAVEVTEQSYGGYTVYMKIINIDVTEILKAIYGVKDASGERLQYQASIVRPINQSVFLLSIQRLNVSDAQALAEKVGVVSPMNSTIAMVRS